MDISCCIAFNRADILCKDAKIMKKERFMVIPGNQSVYFVILSGLFAFLALLPGQAFCQYGGGSGTKASPYLIKTAAQFMAISDNPDDFSSYFSLSNDISLIGLSNNYDPIGNSTNQFKGNFNGNGKTISGFIFSRALNEGEYNDFGIFGYIGTSGVVENLRIENGDIYMYNKGYIGFIAARNAGAIRNCHVSGSIEAGWSLGGIVGENIENAIIKDCSATNMEIYGMSNAIGGIAGINRGLISKTYVETSPGKFIESYTNNVGGLAGYNGDNGNITNCYAIANTRARTTQVGGLAGYGSTQSSISYCYAVGNQTFSAAGSNQARGGLIARNSGTISNCLWDTDVNESSEEGIGVNNGGTVSNALGYGTTDMQTEQTYLDIDWDFDAIWTIYSGGYPILASLPDLTITYDSYHEDNLNTDIIIPVTINNISSFGGGESVTISIFTSAIADADWDTIEDDQTPTKVSTTVPAAGDSKSLDITLPAKTSVGEYYYRMKINEDLGLEESDVTNNWGAELKVKIFNAQFGEDDDTINDVTEQEPSFPRTASIYPGVDIDWVKLEITDVSQVTLTLTNSYEANLVMELYNADGTEADLSPNNAEGDGTAELTVILDAATYYIKIYQPDSEVVMQYSLVAEIEKILPDVSVELNSLDTIYRELIGQSFVEINFTMVNNSIILSDSFNFQLVTSETDTIDLNDPGTYTLVDGQQGRISLAAEEEYNDLFSFLPSGSVKGDRYYAVIVDFNEELNESNENNNISSSVRVHTYVLDSYEPDNSQDDAKIINFDTRETRSIESVGDEDYMYFELTQKSKVTVEITSNSLLKLSIMLPGSTENLGFDTTTSSNNKYTYTVLLDAGTYYLKVNEPGNDLEVPEYIISVKSVIHAADLTCSLAKKYLNVVPGTTNQNTTVFISNIGSASVSGVNAKLKMASSQNADWSTATELATLDNTVSLTAYQTNATGIFTFNVPLTDGIYYLKAFVDAEGLIDEIDEDNNGSAILVLVVGDEYGYSGGSGTKSSPWLISTAFDLDMISEIPAHFENYFELTNDIDMSTLENDYTSIGTSSSPFKGVFDGLGYTISNYTINTSGIATGIFGYTGKSGTISSEINDVKLTAVDIISDSYSGACGALVGNNSCNIYYCSVSGNIDTDGTAGMLAGKNETNSMILYCYTSQSTINSSGSNCGMLVGENAGVIMNCYADEGLISAAGGTGGLCGTNDGSIYDSYSLATVMASGDNVGGFTGTNNGYIGFCYSTGSLSISTDKVYGGFCGLNNGSISASFWSKPESGINTDMSIGIGVTGLTATEMLDKSIYESAGWLFGDTPYSSWLMADGHILPKLKKLYYFGGGEGTLESPYLLRNYVDLLLAGDLLGMHYKLNADIDLTGLEFDKPLFGSYIEDRPFMGTFDGDGHAISNFTLLGGRSYVGIFGYIEDIDSEDDYIAGVSNLAIYDAEIEADVSSEVAGVIAGVLTGGQLSKCTVRNANLIASDFVGGLVGSASRSSISNCCFDGTIVAIDFVGGLAGSWRSSTVSNCYSNADIMAIGNYYGLSGYSYSTIPDRCYYGPNIYADNWGENLQSNADFWYNSETGWDMIGETTNGNENLWQTIDGYGYPWLYYEDVFIPGDLDNNDKVDMTDFGILAENWLDSYEMEDIETISETWLLEIYIP